MKHLYFYVILAATLLWGNQGWAQPFEVEDRDLYEFFKNIPIDYSVGVRRGADGVAKSGSSRASRPDHVNNQATDFFPPIFNQSGGSCGSSANVAYMLCYELNSYYKRDGKHNTDYQLPSHFTWLTCSNSCPESVMAQKNGVPSVTVYGGQTYSRYFGLQDTEEKDAGWMQGYDKWYSAMFNRARSMGKFQYTLDTPEGFEMAKDWLWNHCGDESFGAGGVFVIGVAASPEYTLFPNTPANKEAGVIGHHYVTTWGPKYNHAMTVVGYDDRVEFDLDNNGVVGEKEKGETGAWIIANSWGEWCDAGTIYCPYAYTYCVGLSGSTWDPAFYHPRKDYRPLRTIKLLMDYSRRPEICMWAGISQDTSATQPDFGTSFAHFNYTGTGKTGSNDIPMLGRWVDGYHHEPMELGYDLTDLTDQYDRTKPLKYFFYITTKYSASGKGNIYKASILDYEFERDGIEIPFRIDTVAILNKGKTTMISVIVPGEQIYKPLNLSLVGKTLSWQSPKKSNMPLKGYAVYMNKEKIAELDAATLTYNVGDMGVGPYSVSAIYEYAGEQKESAHSNEVYDISPVAEGNNKVLELVNTGIRINNAIPNELHDATIEFWINPYSTTNYNQQIGYGWGTFLFHATGSGNIYVGWNTGSDRITSASGLLTANKWTHVAVTIKSNVMTLYVNGVKKNTITSSAYSGLAVISSFMIGDSYYKFDGKIDEFRIWDCCRTADEIKAAMNSRVANPATQPHLLVCLNMASVARGEQTILPDYASGRDVDITGLEGCTVMEDATLFNNGATTLKGVDFAFEKDVVWVGEAVTPVADMPFGATKMAWSAPGAVVSASESAAPEFVFDKAGTYSVTLRAYDASDNMVEASKQLTVNPQPKPVADFELSADSVVAGDKVSLINRSVGGNLSYRWTMEGADTETSTSTNTVVSYVETGLHPITLTVTNEAGSASVTKYVKVTNAMPIINFSVTPATIILGDKVALTDNSKYEPTKWLWTVSNDRHNVAINGKDYAYVPKAPGVYDVTLTATNNMGTSTATQKRAFMVSNADPGNGLHFGGGSERIVFKSPMGAPSKTYTIDYWLFPYKCEGAANLCSDDGVFSMTTTANGETTLSVNNKSVASGEGYVISNEWHHYAVTCKSGTVVFYRDGEVFAKPSSRLSLTSPAWGGNITMGSADSPFEGMIDEFKFWGKSLTLDELQATCNQPIANPDSMKTHGSLVMYYDFNQTSGNVESKTDAEYMATRLDFGPDGDAWMSSLGVFTLDFGEKAVETDVTDDYLTNYKAPFLHTSRSINSTNFVSRFYELETETSKSSWVVENTLTENEVTTGVYVDTYFNSDFTCTTGDMGFANSISDQRVYQTVTLSAGRYRLCIEPNVAFSSSGSYLVASVGDTLVGNARLDDALGYALLEDKELRFDVMEDATTVSLGVIFNMTNSRTVAIESFKLMCLPFEYIVADDPNAVDDVETAGGGDVFAVEAGGVRITKPTELRITATNGMDVFNGYAEAGRLIRLVRGIYVINGTKVEVR